MQNAIVAQVQDCHISHLHNIEAQMTAPGDTNLLNYFLRLYVDVLVDGEFQIEKRDITLLWKGSSNQRVIDVQATLAQDKPSVPVLHCEDHDDVPMGRESVGYGSDCCDNENIIQFFAEAQPQKQNA